jgi:EmrB/QacA subfamily drug resistance transporter
MSTDAHRNPVSFDGTDGSAAPDRQRWKALGVIALVQLILVLDITVVNVALPHIQVDLGFSRAGLAWVVDGYVLTAGGLILLGGRLADLLGRKRMFLVGVSLFAVASTLSGAAVDPAMLVASRFLQGIGEAIAGPAAFGLIALLFTEPKERAQAIGVFGGVAGLGGTLGPIISGLLIAAGSWRWIFFVNVPVAAIAVVAVARMVHESRAEVDPLHAGQRPDVAGAVLGTAGLSGIVYGFIAAGTHAWGSVSVAVPLAAGVFLLACFVLQERRAGAPLVPAGFLKNRTRVTANITSLFFASAFFAMFFLLTLYFQEVEHWSAIRTGLAYLPFGVVIGLGIAISSGVVPKLGVKPLLSAGFVLVAAGLFLLSRITVDGSYWTEAFPGLVVMALGSGILFATFGVASMHEVSGQDASLAAGVQSTAQQVGGAVGLAVLATLALRHARAAVAHGVVSTVASTNGAAVAFRAGAVVALAGGVIVAMVRFGGPSVSVVTSRAFGPAEPSSIDDTEPAPA